MAMTSQDLRFPFFSPCFHCSIYFNKQIFFFTSLIRLRAKHWAAWDRSHGIKRTGLCPGETNTLVMVDRQGCKHLGQRLMTGLQEEIHVMLIRTLTFYDHWVIWNYFYHLTLYFVCICFSLAYFFLLSFLVFTLLIEFSLFLSVQPVWKLYILFLFFYISVYILVLAHYILRCIPKPNQCLYPSAKWYMELKLFNFNQPINI